ncbi:MAG TPA: OmpA family protein [Allosphingosinicella sp.]
MKPVRFLAAAAALALLGSPAQACLAGWRLISFAPGSASLDRIARSMLDNEVADFRYRPVLVSRVVTGHADRVGSAAANRRLSRRRAEAVRDYLAARGIPYASMTIVAVGESRPMVDTADGVPEALNRFVMVEEVPTRAEMERRIAEREARGDTSVC